MPRRATQTKPGTHKVMKNTAYESMVVSWLMQDGWQVFLPMLDHGHKTDILISDGPHYYRIQIKTLEASGEKHVVQNLWKDSHCNVVVFFARNSNSFGDFAKTVHTDLYAQSVYAGAPVTAADLQTSITAFTNAKIAQATGGTLATATKNQCRADLTDQLRDLGYYVQVACQNDLAVLLSSGFKAVSRNRTPSALPKAMVERIATGHSGQALVTAKAERNARTYEVMAAEVDESGALGPYGPPVLRSSSRKIPVDGLTAGRMYVFRVRVIGSNGDVSDWSDPVAQRVL